MKNPNFTKSSCFLVAGVDIYIYTQQWLLDLSGAIIRLIIPMPIYEEFISLDGYKMSLFFSIIDGYIFPVITSIY